MDYPLIIEGWMVHLFCHLYWKNSHAYQTYETQDFVRFPKIRKLNKGTSQKCCIIWCKYASTGIAIKYDMTCLCRYFMPRSI